jgi:hypothetical protein
LAGIRLVTGIVVRSFVWAGGLVTHLSKIQYHDAILIDYGPLAGQFNENRTMRLPRAQFTLRRMMVAVAVLSIASLFWAAWMNRRAAYCRSQAEWHASKQLHLGKNREYLLTVAGRAKDPALASYLGYDAERHRLGMIWHAQRGQEYRRAAWRLWEPTPNYPADAPWPAIPPALFPPGADPNDFWITTDGRWGTRAQVNGPAPPSG